MRELAHLEALGLFAFTEPPPGVEQGFQRPRPGDCADADAHTVLSGARHADRGRGGGGGGARRAGGGGEGGLGAVAEGAAAGGVQGGSVAEKGTEAGVKGEEQGLSQVQPCTRLPLCDGLPLACMCLCDGLPLACMCRALTNENGAQRKLQLLEQQLSLAGGDPHVIQGCVSERERVRVCVCVCVCVCVFARARMHARACARKQESTKSRGHSLTLTR